MSRLIPYRDRWKRNYPFWISEADYWREYAEELAMYNDNAMASKHEHNAQLARDFDIYYDAPCDLYRKLNG